MSECSYCKNTRRIIFAATKSLLNYVNILQNLKKVKGMAIQYVKYLVRSMMSLLYYAKVLTQPLKQVIIVDIKAVCFNSRLL
jgi:hypothetical protein